ncbi:MAG TPA: carbohydrate porin [Chthonomonadaceae bacterium]|nr:carbohydrate porin [Chthonomonadaceae bacterium]
MVESFFREWRACTVIWGALQRLALSLALTAAAPAVARAQDAEKPKPVQTQSGSQNPPASAAEPEPRFDVGGEATAILQTVPAFHSPYAGQKSLPARGETEITQTYSLYLGARLAKNLEIYADPELALGRGVGNGSGLAAYPNGDVIGQGALRPEPYLARYFVRWRVPMPHLLHHPGGESTAAEQTGRAPNIIAGTIPAHRLVVQAGKLAASDVFDVNSYANNPRSQFLNNAFGNNLAFDYPQETRGYDLGATVAWIDPGFALRIGTFAAPTVPGGPDLAYNLRRNHGEQVEVELHPRLLRAGKPPLIVRLLGFRDTGSMGAYRSALAAQMPAAVPNIAAVRRQGAIKYGFGLNFEQALADGGDTGVFGRVGWSDGATETFAFAEADTTLSVGLQLSGAHWKRKSDRVGFAIAQNEISAAHADYLAAGGIGFAVGDGALRRGAERAAEVYYSCQVARHYTVSVNLQEIGNPGYNRDRGPVSVFSLRARASF